jgi:hypothetical protein
MGYFMEEITLENVVDRGLASRGYIKETEVRTLTVQAMPDTGVWTLVITEAQDVLLGALPLEGMDLIVDPVRKKLAGAHGDRPLHRLYRAS